MKIVADEGIEARLVNKIMRRAFYIFNDRKTLF
jgi:hypothetical protein